MLLGNAFKSFVTMPPPPPPSPGGGRGMEMSGTLTKDLPRQCGASTRGLLYVGKKGCEIEKIAGCGRQQQWFYQ